MINYFLNILFFLAILTFAMCYELFVQNTYLLQQLTDK
jgi:hypothetical protein